MGGSLGVCSHSVWQEVECASVTGWGAGGGDLRDTRTVGNDASRDAPDSDFMVRSARIRVVCRGAGGRGWGDFYITNRLQIQGVKDECQMCHRQ